jgi:proteasome lid subunit RPN8/RPN11
VGCSRHPAVIKKLQLTNEHWQAMHRHVQDSAPLEACGLLAGNHDRIQVVLKMQNQARSPSRFMLDPQEQLKAFDWIELQGLELVGIYHSHPSGPETVSSIDILEAAYDVVHVVWSRPLGEWQARGFWIENQQVIEVTLQIVLHGIPR